MSTRLFQMAAFVILASLTAFAQSNQGTITGTVSDPASASVPGSQIEVKNSETGVVYRGGTSNTGNFVIPVPAGTYELTVNAARPIALAYQCPRNLRGLDHMHTTQINAFIFVCTR